MALRGTHQTSWVSWPKNCIDWTLIPLTGFWLPSKVGKDETSLKVHTLRDPLLLLPSLVFPTRFSEDISLLPFSSVSMEDVNDLQQTLSALQDMAYRRGAKSLHSTVCGGKKS